MNDKEARKKLSKWVMGLSPETTKDLEKTLEAVIPIGEVHGSMPLSLSNQPIEVFKFSERGVSEVTALAILEAFRWQIDRTQMAVADGRIFLTLEAIELLKYAQQLITGKSDSKKPITKGDPFLFYLSRTKGLYRIFRNETKPYPVHKSKYRFKILDTLTNDFQRTQGLAEEVGTTQQKLRAQIAGIRKLIEKYFDGILGKDFIQGEKTSGYRLGEKIVLTKRE